MQVFKFVFGVLSGILDGQQVVSVGIFKIFSWLLGFLQVFLVRILDLCRFLSWFLGFFQVFKMASRLFQLVFWDFQVF